MPENWDASINPEVSELIGTFMEKVLNKGTVLPHSTVNEYILTKDDVENYSPEEIKTSFNPEKQEDEFKF